MRSRKVFGVFIGLAVIAGLLALLTPCVFPMIPVTVAFFTKQGEAGSKETLRLAALFGAGIVGTYTVTGMLLSVVLGAAGAVQFATNGWVNLAIGVMFTLFAFSLMGFIQLNVPGGFGNLADRWSRKLSGTVGVLAMGLAFTLTSFTLYRAVCRNFADCCFTGNVVLADCWNACFLNSICLSIFLAGTFPTAYPDDAFTVRKLDGAPENCFGFT